MKNTQNIKKRLHRSQDRMRTLCHILAAALFLSGILSPRIPARADPEDSPTYQVRTRWYERFPDGRHAVIKFPKIVGTGNEEAYANINYILEREAFRIAGEFVSDLHQYDNIFQAIAALKNQSLFVSYEVLYQDERLLSVEIEGEATYYTEKGDIYSTPSDKWHYLFDISTGRQLSLSDFVELDRRIVDYRSENYEAPDYDRPTHTAYYSFMDAFCVYEEEAYDHHREMNVEEALEMLKDEKIYWAVTADKDLLLYYYFYSDGSFILIPYSYIADFAHY